MRKGKTEYTDAEKALVGYLKDKLVALGVKKFPRDWHLKQLSTARAMLAGENAPSLDDWKACIDWAFNHDYWCDKVDHLARVENLWTKFVIQSRKPIKKLSPQEEKRRALLRSLYI